jgi:Protein of unknown function (DUF2585)
MRFPAYVYAVAAAAIVAIAMLTERALGRQLWGINGQPGIWSGDVNSSHNSQYLVDPYSFSHITHGIALYALIWLACARLPLRTRALLAVALESAWEVFENTDFVINRYRAKTISLHYFGDSIFNSMGDIMFCVLGFFLAAILPTRVTIVLTIALEIGLALWIRDNLALNIIMLIQPIRAVRNWQAR